MSGCFDFCGVTVYKNVLKPFDGSHLLGDTATLASHTQPAAFSGLSGLSFERLYNFYPKGSPTGDFLETLDVDVISNTLADALTPFAEIKTYNDVVRVISSCESARHYLRDLTLVFQDMITKDFDVQEICRELNELYHQLGEKYPALVALRKQMQLRLERHEQYPMDNNVHDHFDIEPSGSSTSRRVRHRPSHSSLGSHTSSSTYSTTSHSITSSPPRSHHDHHHISQSMPRRHSPTSSSESHSRSPPKHTLPPPFPEPQIPQFRSHGYTMPPTQVVGDQRMIMSSVYGAVRVPHSTGDHLRH
ncbi:hypothetical protein SISSUDRAFT_1048639 [Sistotremastrum suecicum HHB10207 ss-3]|uniref:Uncharacterized protein n=1 Tax=Sistotremastrum suecicum HHB10207 ss-3 TaxID=1314776 RepID=A0A166CCY2_9AGAM|nr:hypothetical protein SISSUDRAFT_1048639 [Sistotremastrum suecicum HHB10207 ss-3]